MTSSTSPGRAREWSTNVVQWDPARNAIKHSVHGFAALRGRWQQRTGKVPEIANIYAASSPKAGSQWMKALFDHPTVRSHTGLLTLPQLDYQTMPDKKFPAGTFVPGFYCSYDEYVQRPKLVPHRVVYMFRDPRDLVVSAYYSATKTHRKTHLAWVEDLREELSTIPFDEALLNLISAGSSRLREVETWADADDDAVAKFRLEEVEADPRGQIAQILRHCEVELSANELETVLMDVSRDSLQAKDLAQRSQGDESHYRVDRRTFRDVFKTEHYAAMEEIAPGLIAKLGYPD